MGRPPRSTNTPAISSNSSHAQELDPTHRKWLARSIDRCDLELSALEKLHVGLAALRNRIVEHWGDESILLERFGVDVAAAAGVGSDSGDGTNSSNSSPVKIEERTPDSVTSADPKNPTSESDTPDTPTGSTTPTVDETLETLLLEFGLRMKLRRKLLNRLARRLNRCSHAMDGESVIPPPNPKYGDVRYEQPDENDVEVFRDNLETRTEAWNWWTAQLRDGDIERGELIRMVEEYKRNGHVGYVNDVPAVGKLTEEEVEAKRLQDELLKEEQKEKMRKMLGARVGGQGGGKTLRLPAAIEEEEPDVPVSQEDDAPTTVTSAAVVEESPRKKRKIVPAPEKRILDALIEYELTTSSVEPTTLESRDASPTIILSSPPKSISNSNGQPEYAAIKYGAGIGAAHRSMSQREKEAEWLRWQTDLLARVPEQLTFEELGCGEGRVFEREKRWKVILDKKKKVKEEEEKERTRLKEAELLRLKKEEDEDTSSSDEETENDTKEKEMDTDEDRDELENVKRKTKKEARKAKKKKKKRKKKQAKLTKLKEEEDDDTSSSSEEEKENDTSEEEDNDTDKDKNYELEIECKTNKGVGTVRNKSKRKKRRKQKKGKKEQKRLAKEAEVSRQKEEDDTSSSSDEEMENDTNEEKENETNEENENDDEIKDELEASKRKSKKGARKAKMKQKKMKKQKKIEKKQKKHKKSKKSKDTPMDIDKDSDGETTDNQDSDKESDNESDASSDDADADTSDKVKEMDVDSEQAKSKSDDDSDTSDKVKEMDVDDSEQAKSKSDDDSDTTNSDSDLEKEVSTYLDKAKQMVEAKSDLDTDDSETKPVPIDAENNDDSTDSEDEACLKKEEPAKEDSSSSDDEEEGEVKDDKVTETDVEMIDKSDKSTTKEDSEGESDEEGEITSKEDLPPSDGKPDEEAQKTPSRKSKRISQKELDKEKEHDRKNNSDDDTSSSEDGEVKDPKEKDDTSSSDEDGEVKDAKEKDDDASSSEEDGEVKDKKEKDEDASSSDEDGEVKDKKEKDEDASSSDEDGEVKDKKMDDPSESKEKVKDDPKTKAEAEDEPKSDTTNEKTKTPKVKKILPSAKKKKRPFSITPVPSFYSQDMRRIRAIHADLVEVSMHEQARKKIQTVTDEYNAILRQSTDLQSHKIRLQSELHKSMVQFTTMVHKKKRDYSLELAIARAKWQRRKDAWKLERSNRNESIRAQLVAAAAAASSQQQQQNLRGQVRMHNRQHAGNTRHVVRQMITAMVNEVVGRNVTRKPPGVSVGIYTPMPRGSVGNMPSRGMLAGQGYADDHIMDGTNPTHDIDGYLQPLDDTFEEFVPPPKQPEERVPDHLRQQHEKNQAIYREEISKALARFAASEDERAKSWKSMMKVKMEVEGNLTTSGVLAKKGRGGSQIPHTELPMPPLKAGKSFTPQPMPEFTPMSPAQIAATVDRRVGHTNSGKRELKPGTIEYMKKYSIDATKARMFSDGSVVPVTLPKRNKDGLFQRPAGRKRKGMDWDAIKGRWVPNGEETH